MCCSGDLSAQVEADYPNKEKGGSALDLSSHCKFTLSNLPFILHILSEVRHLQLNLLPIETLEQYLLCSQRKFS